MDIITKDASFSWDNWEDPWPLGYPAWSDMVWFREDDDPAGRSQQELYEQAQKRANRRQERKASQAARAQGLRRRHPMPGAWPV